MNAKGRSLVSTYLLVIEGGKEKKNTQKEKGLNCQEPRERRVSVRVRYMALGVWGTWHWVSVQTGPLSRAEWMAESGNPDRSKGASSSNGG